MKKIALSILFAFVMIIVAISAVSCSGEKNGKHLFEKNMLSDYMAEIDFLIDFDGNPLSGSAKITKNKLLRLDVYSPDPYSGISIECDVSGKADMISIVYSGIKVEIPRNAMEKLVFLANMMSESTAFAIKEQKDSSFTKCEELYVSEDIPNAVPYEVRFQHDGADYIYIYDSVTGIPLEIFADNDYCIAEIKVKKLITEEPDSEE